jgi:hypothetical protein
MPCGVATAGRTTIGWTPAVIALDLGEILGKQGGRNAAAMDVTTGAVVRKCGGAICQPSGPAIDVGTHHRYPPPSLSRGVKRP